MTAPLFKRCATNADVTALLGTDPVRVFPFGLAPLNVMKPYAVWQVVGGTPENLLAGRPSIERQLLQIDVYADSAEQARTVLATIEHAIELECYVTRYSGESRDPDTQSYRSSMDVDWLVPR